MRFSENGGCQVNLINNDVDILVRLLTASNAPREIKVTVLFSANS